MGFRSSPARAATIRARVGVISGRSATCAIALVGEVVQLTHDLVPALGGVEIERLQRRPVILLEPVAGGHRTPGLEDVGAEREIGGVKITKARQGLGLHGGSISGAGRSGKR